MRKENYLLAWLFEILGALFLILSLVTLFSYHKLPELIPVHFNIFGEADNWGSRSNILVVLILELIIYAGLSVLQGYPEVFDKLLGIKPPSSPKVHAAVTDTIRYFKVLLVAVIAYGLYGTYTVGMGYREGGLGVWPGITFITGCVLILVLFFIRMQRAAS